MVLAIAFAASVLGNMLKKGSQNKQINEQNKATLAQNQRLLLQAGQEASAAYAQAGSLSSQATGKMAEADRIAGVQAGQQAVTAAASGTTGSSVQAVQYDIQRQEEQSQASIAADLMTQVSNLRSQANAAYSTAINRFGTAVKGQTGFSSLFSSVLGGAVSTAAANPAATYAAFGGSSSSS